MSRARPSPPATRSRRAWPGLGLLLVLLLLAPLGGPGALADDPPGEGPGAPFPPDLPFDPAQWTTVADYPPIGDPAALRTESKPIKVIWADYPPTLRTDGPNSNLSQTATVEALLFEALIQIHPNTEEFIPYLASHWRIETDEEAGTQTFTFRIDERARFSDGQSVTARDVYDSFWHKVQEDRSAPSNYMTFTEGYHEPEILDRLTIRVKTKELNWRLFLYFGGMQIFPSKYVRIPGGRYLEEYNWTYMPGTGPYVMTGLKKGDSLTLTRRKDWWAENEAWGRHTFNFQQVRFEVVRDKEIEFERFKKGDLDYFIVVRAQRWVEELPREQHVLKGWIQRRKVWTKAPEGFAGLAFNMRKPPFDDKRIRLAFCHLFNREKLMERLFFGEYEPINSYEPGRDWGAGDTNEPMYFDPDYAGELLAEAGYETRNQDGWLVGPDGRILEVTLPYSSQAWERIWLNVKEDYEDAGVKFNLELISPATLIKRISDRQFTLHFQSWGALLFPNPETGWRSSLADQKNNNNITGFKNDRVDELCKEYNKVFERARQKEITREIDRIVYAEHPYALGWFANFHRVIYWDKFGQPASYFTRTGQYPEDSLLQLWWWDPAREAALEKAQKDGTPLPPGEVEVRPWAK